MSVYVDIDYYIENDGSITDTSIIDKFLTKAEGIVNNLTYQRITQIGFLNCSEWEQEIIKECVCEIADFQYMFKDILNSVSQNYSINGVSMTINPGQNYLIINGYAIPNETYNKLLQTRFACQNFGW